MKLYHIYNSETFEVTALLSEVKPKTVINHIVNGQIKPIYDVDNNKIIEGATQEEIKQRDLELKSLNKQLQYNELSVTDWYFTRYQETGVEVPKEILEQRKQIREKYDAK